MNSFAKPVVLLSAMMAATGAFAVPFAVEGTLGSVAPVEPPSASATGVMVCNGVTIELNEQTQYTSPTRQISLPELLRTAPFPGTPLAADPTRNESAFVGGTCIVSGESTSGRNIAQSVYVEVRENVLVGPSTAQAPFAIMGIRVVLQTDDRMKAGPVVNSFGFEIDLDTVPVGDESSAEGYLGRDGIFYAHAIETTGGTPTVDPNAPPPPDSNVTRGVVSSVNATTVKLDIRGTCRWFTSRLPSDPASRTQGVLVLVDNGTQMINPANRVSGSKESFASNVSNVTCTEDPAVPNHGEFRLRVDRFTGFSAVPTFAISRVATPDVTTPNPWSPNFVLDRAGFR